MQLSAVRALASIPARVPIETIYPGLRADIALGAQAQLTRAAYMEQLSVWRGVWSALMQDFQNRRLFDDLEAQVNPLKYFAFLRRAHSKSRAGRRCLR